MSNNKETHSHVCLAALLWLRYDRTILKAADIAVKGAGDGRIAEKDVRRFDSLACHSLLGCLGFSTNVRQVGYKPGKGTNPSYPSHNHNYNFLIPSWDIQVCLNSGGVRWFYSLFRGAFPWPRWLD